jgi:NAD(P)H dehydrogenase (quinone)
MILVTGAAGKTGTAIIRALVARRQSVRALVHRREQVETTKSIGAEETIVGDIRSLDTLSDALEHVEAVYHICPNMDPNELSIGNSVIEVARAADVESLVFHSVLHPQIEEMSHHWNKMRVEEALFKSGLKFTILQPCAYMQNLLGEWNSIVEHGVYAVPYSLEAPMSLVDLEDVAQVAATVLSEPDHVGAIYELAGPEVLTPIVIASILESNLGRKLRVEQITREAWKQNAERLGLGEYQVNTLVKMFEYYDRYGLQGNPRITRTLLGREPTRFSEFLERTVHERYRPSSSKGL